MTPRPDERDLLDDVLADALPPGFREELLASTLTSVRRRRRTRAVARAGMALAAVAVVAWVGWRTSVSSPAEPESRPPACRVVVTEPLSADAIVRTRAFAPEQVAVSSSFSATVRTLPGITRLIDDRELLELAGPYSGVLVRISPQEQRLVMPGAKEEEAAPR